MRSNFGEICEKQHFWKKEILGVGYLLPLAPKQPSQQFAIPTLPIHYNTYGTMARGVTR